jgi:hypothetical protein
VEAAVIVAGVLALAPSVSRRRHHDADLVQGALPPRWAGRRLPAIRSSG